MLYKKEKELLGEIAIAYLSIQNCHMWQWFLAYCEKHNYRVRMTEEDFTTDSPFALPSELAYLVNHCGYTIYPALQHLCMSYADLYPLAVGLGTDWIAYLHRVITGFLTQQNQELMKLYYKVGYGRIP